MSNFYSQSQYATIERAILAEDLVFTEMKDTKGKFYLKILTPTVDTKAINIKATKAGVTSNYVNLVIPGYMLLEFMNPLIKTIKTQVNGKTTSYNCITFKKTEFTIPKDTSFLVGFLGGDIKLEKANIIGVELGVYASTIE